MATSPMVYNPDYVPEEGAYTAAPAKADPQNIEAEKIVLAACLLRQDAINEVAVKLEASDFYRSSHQIIFQTMFDMSTRQIPVDHISLADHLKAAGQLDAVGGPEYLMGLADNTFALTNWQNHVEIVKRTSMLRQLIRASASIQALAYDAPADLDEVVEEAEKTLFSVTEKRVSSDFQTMQNLVGVSFEQIQQLAAQENKITGVASGFHDVDELFHGFRPGDLVILAARPGVGKTSFALNLATNAAKLGTTVAFLSLEMSAEQLVQRIICSEARVSLANLRSGKVQDSDWPALIEACGWLSDLPMVIDDTPALSILELRSKARRQLRGVENGLIIVDYLQLMQPPRSRADGNRAVEVGEISRGLKVLAKEMGMPVIALSQLSRSIETRTKKRPMLSDLRESGSIEQDADIVAFIDRSIDEVEAESEDRPPLGQATLIVAKHRNGPTRDIPLAFKAEYTRFMDFVDESRVADYM